MDTFKTISEVVIAHSDDKGALVAVDPNHFAASMTAFLRRLIKGVECCDLAIFFLIQTYSYKIRNQSITRSTVDSFIPDLEKMEKSNSNVSHFPLEVINKVATNSVDKTVQMTTTKTNFYLNSP